MPYVSELAASASDNEVREKKLFQARGKYDFAVDGGAVGDIPLGVKLPKGALVREALINVITVPTSAGAATIALKLEAAGDVQAAAAISGAPWSTTGIKLASLTRTAAPVNLTLERELTATVGTAALTAGVFEVLIEYELGF